MPAIESADALFDLLAGSRLFSSERMAEIRRTYGGEADARRVARRLARHGHVTRWQAEQLLAGRNSFVFGQYTLLSLIGKGNMGAVFEARHQSHPRTVALKIMAKEILKDPVKVARFQREMRTVELLKHPNIVAFYDGGKEGSVNYLAMEFVPGRDLRDLLRDHEELPVDFACECCRQAALGLQHACENGLVHRDIKPDNLLVQLDSHGRPLVKILDLGLAKISSEEESQEASLTRPGQLVGTPNYVAPELVVHPDHIDVRADIYSLGCTLFRLLTGQLPTAGETAMEKLVNRVKQDAPNIRTLRDDVPEGLAHVIAKMLVRDPKKRYQKPIEVAEALSPYCWKLGDPPPEVNLFRQPPEDEGPSEMDARGAPNGAASPSMPAALAANVNAAMRMPVAASPAASIPPMMAVPIVSPLPPPPPPGPDFLAEVLPPSAPAYVQVWTSPNQYAGAGWAETQWPAAPGSSSSVDAGPMGWQNNPRANSADETPNGGSGTHETMPSIRTGSGGSLAKRRRLGFFEGILDAMARMFSGR